MKFQTEGTPVIHTKKYDIIFYSFSRASGTITLFNLLVIFTIIVYFFMSYGQSIANSFCHRSFEISRGCDAGYRHAAETHADLPYNVENIANFDEYDEGQLYDICIDIVESVDLDLYSDDFIEGYNSAFMDMCLENAREVYKVQFEEKQLLEQEIVGEEFDLSHSNRNDSTNSIIIYILAAFILGSFIIVLYRL